jgi:putative ABC transport system substrate-binding protein
MKRATFVGSLGAASAALASTAFGKGGQMAAAAESGGNRKYKIYMALYRGRTVVEDGFQDYLARRGLDIEYVVGDAKQEKSNFPKMIEQIREVKPDLVYAFATEGALGICGTVKKHKGKITEFPVVFVNVGDPVAAGLVSSLSSRTRDITGVIHLAPMDVQLNAMQQYMPIKTLGVLYNSAESYGKAAVGMLQDLAFERKIKVVIQTVNNAAGDPEEAFIQPALEAIAQSKPDMLYFPSTSFFIPLAPQITEVALKLGLPTFSGNEALVRGGYGMAALAGSFHEVGQFAGLKAEKILRDGIPANQVPIEALSRFTMLVNIDVCKKLGVYPPLPMLKYAEIVKPKIVIPKAAKKVAKA